MLIAPNALNPYTFGQKAENRAISEDKKCYSNNVDMNNVNGKPFDRKFLGEFYAGWIRLDISILERVEEMLLDFVPRVQLHLLGFPDAFVHRENSDGSRNSLGADRIAIAIQRTFEKEVYRRWKAQTVCLFYW